MMNPPLLNRLFRRLSMCGALIIAALASALTGSPHAQAAPTAPALPPNDPHISYRFAPVATGLSRPLFVTHAGDDRLFIVEQTGLIKIKHSHSPTLTTFLNVSSLIPPISGSSEQGLLGLAFEPNYATTGRFYIYYTNTSGNLVLARYTVSSNPDVADPLSAQIILPIPHPSQSNHNGGWIGFGPDNYLYLTPGDGGGSNDQYCNAQNVTQRLGKILRINVIGQMTYTIPAGNVFTPTQAPEVWAIGLRNPYRNSFDRLTGDLYVGDVGQGAWEEVNYLPAGTPAGTNFGWSQFEGTHPFSSGCTPSGIAPTMPVVEYTHNVGGDVNRAVTGGYVYRGPTYPWLQGVYFYGDYGSGRIWAMWQSSPGAFANALISNTAFAISSFGEDRRGELYLTNLNGAVYRLAPVGPMTWLPIIMR